MIKNGFRVRREMRETEPRWGEGYTLILRSNNL